MIILGIDPGTRVTGYGILRRRSSKLIEVIDFGVIRSPTKATLPECYCTIFEALETLISLHAPVAVAVETQFVHKNVNSALKLSMARAMALLAATRKKIPLFEYTPAKAKKAVTGHGSSAKPIVQKMIQTQLGLPSIPTPEDAADGLLLALCHAYAIKREK